MTFDEYQTAAARTMNPRLSDNERLLDAAAGIAEEAGEVLAHVRKHLYRRMELDREKLAEELGDVLWCVAGVASALRLPIRRVAERNVKKLNVRHERASSVVVPTPSVSIRRLRSAIQKLPSDKPKVRPGIWYKTQKEHWLGWLGEYHTTGGYGRRTDVRRDARFAYNHVMNWQMLLWLVSASGVPPDRVRSARRAAQRAPSLAAKAAAVRESAPWEAVAAAMGLSPSRSLGARRK